MSSHWEKRRQAILIAADALERRDATSWREVEDLLYEARSVRADEGEILRAADAPERLNRMLTEAHPDCFATPWEGLNRRLLGGFRRQQFVVLAADPAHGKSLMAAQLLQHFADEGNRCLLLLNEMSAREIDGRWAQSATGIHEERILSGKLGEGEVEQVVSAAASYGFDLAEVSGENFREVADRLRDERPDVAVLDLLSRMPYRDEAELRRGVGELITGAVDADCCLIATHHLNERRVPDSGMRGTPSTHDLRDSGSIKNFAHCVLLLARDLEQNSGGIEMLPTGTLNAAKVRSGSPGGIRVRLDSKRLKFSEVTGEPDQMVAV